MGDHHMNMSFTMLFVLFAATCDRNPRPPAPEPLPDGGTTCAAACDRMEVLGCREAEPEPGLDGKIGTADDVPCIAWMCNADFLPWADIANAQTCEEVVSQ